MSFFQSRLSFRCWTCVYPGSFFYFVVLATLNDLSYQERAMSAASVFPRYPISWTSMDFFRPLDNNVVATFVSHYMITECVLTSELVQVATWLS